MLSGRNRVGSMLSFEEGGVGWSGKEWTEG